ncbi:hypothetical protein BWR18_10025 [Tateyamaria omphalii]|uniref:Uncharacterized protein n=1 Tax=Tateyamaria omphalii TaxID=299262 RepID=A0A1P8MV82_9RHOB|nr:hypothetical protein BWR18_10025 [Tateyamaria omphalii]
MKVTVGHAISPCGDEIIVCDDTSVPICDLIRKCKMAERRSHDCDPPRRMPGSTCEDLEEEWVLAIKYDEKPTRGVLPLRSGTCSSCGAGGSTCVCGGSCECEACCETPLHTPTPKPRTAPDTCEPTVICEGFRFCVYRKPEEEPDSPNDDRRVGLFDDDSDLMKQLECCFDLLLDAVPTMVDLGQTTQLTFAQRQQLTAFCCRLQKNLTNYFMRYPHTSCEVLDILAQLRCPDAANADGYANAWIQSFLTLLAIWLDAIRQCFCLALLPPAPAPACEDRIPLATVRVTAQDCRILSVCNWTTERKILVSWTAVTYWLGSLSIWGLLREALDTVCCGSFIGIFDDAFDDTVGRTTSNNTATEEEIDLVEQPNVPDVSFQRLSTGLNEGFANIAPAMGLVSNGQNLSGFAREIALNFNEPAGLSRILNKASPRFRFPDAGRPLGKLEQANLPELITMELVGKPVIASFFGIADQVAAPDGSDTFEQRYQTKQKGEDVAALAAEVERQKIDIALLKQAIAERGD